MRLYGTILATVESFLVIFVLLLFLLSSLFSSSLIFTLFRASRLSQHANCHCRAFVYRVLLSSAVTNSHILSIEDLDPEGCSSFSYYCLHVYI